MKKGKMVLLGEGVCYAYRYDGTTPASYCVELLKSVDHIGWPEKGSRRILQRANKKTVRLYAEVLQEKKR